MKQVFTNGCSFSTNRKTANARVDTFASRLVADHYNFNSIQYGRGGRGNRRILITTKLFYEYDKERKKDTFAIIQWSGPGRKDYPALGLDTWLDLDTPWRTWVKHEQYEFYMSKKKYDDALDDSFDTLNNIIDLQNYFEVNDIKYVMYFGLPQTFDLRTRDAQLFYEIVDWSKVYRGHHHNYMDHLTFCRDNNYQLEKGVDEHPSYEGHKIWAEGLIEFIDNGKLL